MTFGNATNWTDAELARLHAAHRRYDDWADVAEAVGRTERACRNMAWQWHLGRFLARGKMRPGLTHMEERLAVYLAHRPGQLVTPNELAIVLGYEAPVGAARVIATHFANMRRKGWDIWAVYKRGYFMPVATAERVRADFDHHTDAFMRGHIRGRMTG